jgi:glycolate oxidase FAD binding subunit
MTDSTTTPPTPAPRSPSPTTLRPTDLKEVRDAVLDSAGTLAVTGSGTAAGWAGTPPPVDAVLDLGGLTGIVVHNPGDMTVAVRAGTPLPALNAELAEHGQHVAFDAARVTDGATVGGLLSTGDAGPGALVHGSLRDLVIGTTMVLADGTVARSGGHVIKNVAGYDLTKLVHGAYGTLAVLAEVVLRLHPLPQAAATLVLPCTLDEAAGQAARVLGGPFEPAALEWVADGEGAPGSARSGGALLVRVEGTVAALPARVQRLRELLGGTAAVHDAGPATDERHSGREPSDERAVRADPPGDADPWVGHARLTRGTPEDTVLRLGVRPSRLPSLLAALPTRSITAGLGTGVATVVLPSDPETVASAHAAVHAAGGTSMLRSRPAGSTAAPWGPPPSAIGLLRAVKNALDPAGRLGPGRFAPWF